MTNENEDRIKRLEDQLSGIRAAMRERMGKHLASVGGDSQYVSSDNHAGSWTPTGLDTPVSSNNIHVTTNHNPRDGTVRFYIGTNVPNPKHATAKPHTESPTTRVHLAHGIIYPAGNIDILPKPAWTHTADGTIDEKAIKFILTDHLNSQIKHPTTGKVITVADHHGLQNSLIEEWTQKYKKSIDCSNPKGFSQRAHCQGRKKKLNEDLRRWFKEKWTAQDGSECGDYKGRGRVKCRPSRRVSEKSPQPWNEMSPEQKKKAVRLKQKAHREGKQFSSHKSGKTWDGPKNKYKPGKKKMDEAYLAEDDMGQDRGESQQEYHARLLRQIANNNFASMDHHDRLYGAIAFLEKLKQDKVYPDQSIPPLIVRVKNKKSGMIQHARGIRVTGIGGKPHKAIIMGIPASAGGHRSYHGDRPEEEDVRHITGIMMSNYAFMRPEHINTLQRLINFRNLGENMEQFRQIIIERHKERRNSDCGCNALQEEKKPYKGFKKGKNHPEGGLSRAEAHRQGIHAGIETKDEAKRKGGFGKLSKKTQARRKSFCARMCGMKKRRTSSKTARDPKSKINAALRVWGCRCGTNESHEVDSTPLLTEGKNNPTDKKLWSRAKSLARKKFKVYPSAYANAWAAKWYKKHGGGWSSSKNESYESARQALKEEIVNKQHKGSMTSSEISERDRIAKNAKGIKAIKGKDSEKNARYRYATYIVLRKRSGEGKKESKPKGKKSKNKKKKAR